MPEFRFSAIRNGVEHVKRVEIPDSELESPYPMHDEAKEQYRKNVINKFMNKWALSLFTLSYEEVNTDESESSIKHHTDEQQEEKEADKG